jgi:hypothetical protein
MSLQIVLFSIVEHLLLDVVIWWCVRPSVPFVALGVMVGISEEMVSMFYGDVTPFTGEGIVWAN